MTTFLFELLNSGLLIWILQRVLYRPLREGIEKRRSDLARILEQAREDANSERERVARTLERERGDALVWVREATVNNAVEIAGRLLKDLLPEAADGLLLDALIASLAEHDEAFDEEALAAIGRDGRILIELSMPGTPTEEVLERLRKALAEAIAAPCDLVVREDESLMAGPVLRIGDQVLDASLAGHLDLLRERARGFAEEAARDV